MGKPIDRTGLRYGRLVVIGLGPTNRHRQRTWDCRCDCGGAIVITGGALVTGNTRSCGCIKAESLRERSTTHGLKSRTRAAPEYAVWAAMKSRCSDPANPAYRNYGGRGIAVDAAWSASFGAFIADMGRRPAKGMTLERKDNDGPYAPWNCCWTTRSAQSRNTRLTTRVPDGATTIPLVTLCEQRGVVDAATARWRLNHGWGLEDAVSKPSRKRGAHWPGDVGRGEAGPVTQAILGGAGS